MLRSIVSNLALLFLVHCFCGELDTVLERCKRLLPLRHPDHVGIPGFYIDCIYNKLMSRLDSYLFQMNRAEDSFFFVSIRFHCK